MRRVEAATLEELSARQWARRAVNASGVFPVVEPTMLDSAASHAVAAQQHGGGGVDSNGLRWVCIRIPEGAGKSVLMDTPYGRFAVLVPAGLPAGSPLLVPLPAADADSAAERPVAVDAKEHAREAQLTELVELGFSAQANTLPSLASPLLTLPLRRPPSSPSLGPSPPRRTSRRSLFLDASSPSPSSAVALGLTVQEAAQYCDGTSSVDDLAELIASDAAQLEAGGDREGEGEPTSHSPHARGGSSFCIVS